MIEITIVKIAGGFGFLGFVLTVVYAAFKIIINKLHSSKFTRRQRSNIVIILIISISLISIYAIHGWITVEAVQSENDQAGQVQKSFRILDVNANMLYQVISDSTGLIYDNSDNATFSIRLTYSGSLRPAFNERHYLYNGGHVVVIVNDVVMREIKDLRLSAWDDEPGNPRYLIEKKIGQEIVELVNANPDLVIRAIMECIQYENEVD